MQTCNTDRILTIEDFEKENSNLNKRDFYTELLNKNPNDQQALINLASIECNRKLYAKAINLINSALGIGENSECYSVLSRIQIEQNDFYNAIESSKKAVQLNFDNFEAWFYLGYSLKKNNQIDDAIIAYTRALELKPDSSCAFQNLGNIYRNYKNDPEMAIKLYKQYIKLNPDDTDAKSSLGTLYLKMKNYKDGWKYLEYCINKARAMEDLDFVLSTPMYQKPLWQGENIDGKTVFVYFDGGLGDTIMFARFFKLLKEKCSKIIFCCQEPLIEFLESNNLGIEILPANISGRKLNFDVHLPLMSLPYKLQLNNESDIPFAEGYLKADKQKTEEYEKKFFNNDKFKVGIKWKGNTLYNQTRHIKLKSFYKLFELQNIQFYTLQRDEGAEELELAKDYNLIDLGATFENFADTAAAIENLDLVICNDTSVAHLAGAMGKPCWVLLPFEQDWRWTIDTTYSPWYKSIKLFKQNILENWDEVFDRVYSELINEIP